MTDKTEGKLCFSCVPARHVFVFLTAFGLFLVYAFKGFLGVAIVAMAKHGNTSESFGDECPGIDSHINSSYVQGDFDWDDYEQATILGCFFYGYIILQVPAGILADMFGAKWIFGGSILITAILSLLGPIAAHWGFIPFLITRLLQGLAQGVILPCMNAMLARWMPKMERSRAISIMFAGASIGSVVTLPLTGYLCDATFLGGWPAIFYVLGILGVIWFVLWSIFVYDSPDCHPFISRREYDLINKGQGFEKTSLNGLISSLPYLCQAIVSVVSSYITDKIREKDKINVSNLRKINNSIAFFGPAICLIAVVLSKCNVTLSIALFIIALGCNGCCYPGFNSNYVDMAPDFSGILMGICNSLGNFPGFIAPTAAANFYSDGQTLENWSYVFYTCAAVYIFTQTIHMLFSTSELQPWGISKQTEPEIQKEIEEIKNNSI